MNIKDEKGITEIDITLTVILITIFLAVVLTIFTSIQKNTTKLNRETEAMYYAVDTIENIKSQNFSILPKKGTSKINGVSDLADGYIKDKSGNITSYYRTITVQDYTELSGNSSKTAEVLKKITVEIAYKDQNKDKSVTLSTIKVKGY